MHPTRRLRLLTIDLDDTLWPCYATIGRAEDALFAWIQDHTPRLAQAHDQKALRLHRKVVARSNPAIAHDLTAVRRQSLVELFREHDYDSGYADEAIALFLRHRNRVEPYGDVVPALEALGERFTIVSLTNGNADVEQTPLRGLFDLSLTAADVGAQKPDPGLFRAALTWAGVAPAEALHVGDDPHLDVDAARTVGLASVWMNRSGRAWPGELDPPLAEVSDMGGIERWLETASLGV
jgi:putative hydrolase of the HAD superfamily